MFIDEMDISSHRGRRGLRIFASPKLQVSCTLPASIILVIPTITETNNSSENENSSDSNANFDGDTNNNESYIPYEWVGDTQGEIHEAFMDFIQSLPNNTPSFRICFACSDRMIRDALALTATSLACFDKDIGARDRLISLPWYSSEGIRHTAKVQTLSGNFISI